MQKIFGLSGYAGCGKDTFFDIARLILSKKGLTCQRFALADELKRDIRPFILDKTNIDILSCTRVDKEIIRPLMVDYGEIKRILSNGRQWVDLVDRQVKESKADVLFITDIRHDVYAKDEYYWLKNECGGNLIYIERFCIEDGYKVYLKAPNKEELANNGSLEKKCDLKVSWEYKKGEDLFQSLSATVGFALNKFEL